MALVQTGPTFALDREQQIGAAVHKELEQKRELIGDSPLYAALRPITQRIKRVADPLYEHPFVFYLVREAQPNAFAVPGGNVYVTDALMRFVRTQEELAGVICHEVSHDIHHDVVNNMRKDQEVAVGATIASALFGHGRNRILNVFLSGAAAETELHFSRTVETKADLTGSDICAGAGYNPYGMIWLFERFSATGLSHRPEFFSDHPGDTHRIRNLRRHFARNPAVFGRFADDRKSATPLLTGPAPTASP